MIDGLPVIGIIPARAGSKGLPGKNLRPLCGTPLIEWSIRRALESKYLDTVLVSTDSLEIANLARERGAYVPFIRPHALATDTASTYDVIRHALEYCTQQNSSYEYTVLLEPTSPLRAVGDIDAVIARLHENRQRFDSIVTLGEVGEHPSIMKRIEGLAVQPFVPQLQQTTRRQDNTPAYFPYGVAYAAKTDQLLAQNTFYMTRCMGFALQRYQNYEIDDIYDFVCVEAVMKHEWGVQ